MRPLRAGQPRPRARTGRGLSLAGVGLVAVVAAILWLGGMGRHRGASPGPVATDPRTSAVLYRNTRPGVPYVGDEVCAACHQDIAESYRHHPMGRSLAPVSTVAAGQRYDPAAHNPFDVAGRRYQAENRNGHIWHTETCRDPGGRRLTETREEVRFVIGSGTRAFSYLIDHDGSLFESPISWFSQKGIWDLSPGFGGRAERFDRPVQPECLFCHANYADHRPNTSNSYREPIFRGYAIGCERCHGPGALHVQRQEAGEPAADPDDTIVNPACLPPALRDGVCQQCHLEGEMRILRRGREIYDYRPGLPREQFWAVFVRPQERSEYLVSSFEQLYASRCFQASAGQLGCISCHDPHVRPGPEERAAYYRRRCLQCHQEAGCSRPRAQGRPAGRDEDCTACHMPPVNSSDITHVAISDHRIPRRPAGARAAAAPPEPPRPVEFPLVLFPQQRVDPEDAETSRDLAVAVTILASRAPDAQKPFCLRMLPALKRAVQTWPDDLPARDSLAYVLSVQGGPREALAVCEGTLAQTPNRSATLELAARLAGVVGETAKAVAYWRRVVAINPWWARYRIELAKGLAERGQWPEVVEQCRTILRRDPANAQAHLLLLRYHVQCGDREQARAEAELVLALAPERGEEVRRCLAGPLPSPQP